MCEAAEQRRPSPAHPVPVRLDENHRPLQQQLHVIGVKSAGSDPDLRPEASLLPSTPSSRRHEFDGSAPDLRPEVSLLPSTPSSRRHEFDGSAPLGRPGGDKTREGPEGIRPDDNQRRGDCPEDDAPLSVQREGRTSPATVLPAAGSFCHSDISSAARSSASSPSKSHGESNVLPESSPASTGPRESEPESPPGRGEEAHPSRAPASQEGEWRLVSGEQTLSSPSQCSQAGAALSEAPADAASESPVASSLLLLGEVELYEPSPDDDSTPAASIILARNEWIFLRSAAKKRRCMATIDEDPLEAAAPLSSSPPPLYDLWNPFPLMPRSETSADFGGGSGGASADALLQSQPRNDAVPRPKELRASSSAAEPACVVTSGANDGGLDTAGGIDEPSSSPAEDEKEELNERESVSTLDLVPSRGSEEEELQEVARATSSLDLNRKEKEKMTEEEREGNDNRAEPVIAAGCLATFGLVDRREEKEKEEADDGADRASALTSTQAARRLSRLTHSVSTLYYDMHRLLGSKVRVLWSEKAEKDAQLAEMRQLQEKTREKNRSLAKDLDRAVGQIHRMRGEIDYFRALAENLEFTNRKADEALAREAELRAEMSEMKGGLTMMMTSLAISKHSPIFSAVSPVIDLKQSQDLLGVMKALGTSV